jgi:hypothetical protein
MPSVARYRRFQAAAQLREHVSNNLSLLGGVLISNDLLLSRPVRTQLDMLHSVNRNCVLQRWSVVMVGPRLGGKL